MKIYNFKSLITMIVLLFSVNAYSACDSGSRYNLDRTVFSSNGWHQPIAGTLTTSSTYDYDSDIYTCNFKFRHGAYDIVADEGDTVYAIDNGEVLHIVSSNHATLNTSRIYIKHHSSSGDFIALYGHVGANADIQVGSKVEKGEEIGEIKVFGSPTHIHFGISNTGNDSRIYDATFGSIKGDLINPINYLDNNENLLSRAEALEKIMDKFGIVTLNSGFNTYRFGKKIVAPDDVENSSLYSYIVTAYNKGIASGSSGKFRPTENVTMAEFIIMIDRAIPIPLNNSSYKFYSYNQSDWFYKYVNAAYNANIISNIYYSFGDGINKGISEQILNKSYEYYRGKNSGISIYANWSSLYSDIDLYLYSTYDGSSEEIKYNDARIITNMDELRKSSGIVYWDKYSTTWGANLDYDSWGGNGGQPWAGYGEERITVDTLMVRRPGKYSIILCYFNNWNSGNESNKPINPSEATVEWWGINGGKNINVGGVNFETTLKRGECNYSGTLNTYAN